MPLALHHPLDRASYSPAPRPRVWVSILGSIAAVLGMAASGLAAPVTLYDSIGGLTSNGFDVASSTSWLANQFLTSSDGYAIDSVIIKLQEAPTGAAANVRLTLYGNLHDAGTLTDTPSTSLGDFTNPGSMIAGDNTFLAGGLPALAPNSTYWVVLHVAATGSGGTGPGPGAAAIESARWAYTFGSPGGLSPTDVSTFSADGGATWFPNSTGSPYMMTVNAFVTPVPEPSTYAMGVAGVGVAFLPSILRRLRRRGGEVTLA